MASADEQFAYTDRIADYAGVPRLPEWRKEMYATNSRIKREHPDNYRDVFTAHYELAKQQPARQL
jgi:hypothetical protein